jgi:hypothetical protein
MMKNIVTCFVMVLAWLMASGLPVSAIEGAVTLGETLEVQVVSKTVERTKKSPLLAYLERIERSFSEKEGEGMTSEKKSLYTARLEDKLKRNAQRKNSLLQRQRSIERDLQELELFEKMAKRLLKRLEKLDIPKDETKIEKVIRRNK